MNTMKTPAYVVYYNDQINPPTRTLFTNETLLTARRAAISFAEALFGSQADFTTQEEVDVYLVETGPTTTDNIARILKKRSEQEEELQASPGRSTARHRLHCKDSLLELKKEHDYYRAHDIPSGFGFFSLRVGLSELPAPNTPISVLFDAMGYTMAIVSMYNGVKRTHFTMEYLEPGEPEAAQFAD